MASRSPRASGGLAHASQLGIRLRTSCGIRDHWIERLTDQGSPHVLWDGAFACCGCKSGPEAALPGRAASRHRGALDLRPER
jgi:hypothetical protein